MNASEMESGSALERAIQLYEHQDPEMRKLHRLAQEAGQNSNSLTEAQTQKLHEFDNVITELLDSRPSIITTFDMHQREELSLRPPEGLE